MLPEETTFKILFLAAARRIRIPSSELKHQSCEGKIDSDICVTENEGMFFCVSSCGQVSPSFTSSERTFCKSLEMPFPTM